MRSIVIVDYPLFAQCLSILLQQHFPDFEIITISNHYETVALNALVLSEHFLPEGQRGLLIARGLQYARPDLITIVWTHRPEPFHIWAGLEYKINGFLDKTMPTSDLLYWLDSALKNGSAWPGHLMIQAREWDQVIALRLRALTSDLWLLWAALWHGESNAELVSHLGWSKRTVERRVSELYATLGVRQRAEVVGAAWEWGLVKAHNTGPEWSAIVHELFPTSNAKTK